MNIGIYHEPGGGGLGGAEVMTATIAAALRNDHHVTILHHFPDLTTEQLSTFADEILTGVELKYIPRSKKGWQSWSAPAWGLSRELRAWQANLSAGFDLFIANTHAIPPWNHAPRGILFSLFPNTDRHTLWPWSAQPGKGVLAQAKATLSRWRHERLWRQRMASYGVHLAISEYTAQWTRKYWGIDCTVLWPPVRIQIPLSPKTERIVVLGRFTPMKQQRELVRLFRDCIRPDLPGWELVCIGTVSPSDGDYFREVESIAVGGAVRLLTGVSPSIVRQTLAEAKIFWHGAGLGVDPAQNPMSLEHFGIATVEAMAAGCVPLVPDRGGQAEIVRHGQDGYLCSDLKAMAERTLELARNPAQCETLARNARVRARDFSRDRFVEAVRGVVRAMP